MKKQKIGLFIGRFQPFHKGHLYSLKKALEVSEKIIIGIGSANENGTEDNPLNVGEREEMVRKVLMEEGWEDRIVKIVRIDDDPSDEVWMEMVAAEVGDFSVVVGNNDWVNGLMRALGKFVYETGLHNRDELEGKKIRAMIRGGDDKWRERVPGYLVASVSELLK